MRQTLLLFLADIDSDC